MRTHLTRLGLVVLLATIAGGAVSAPAASATPRLVSIRAAHHPTFDRVVFQFVGGVPQRRGVIYVGQLISDGAGEPVRIAGAAILQVRFEAAVAHRANGQSSAPLRQVYTLPNVMNVVRAGDFEGVVTYGIGVAVKRPPTVRVLTNPARVIVDIDTSFARVTRKVFFQDRARFAAGTTPYERSVNRLVPAAAPARGVLWRMYAGPTAGEVAAGLQLVRSGTTGFRALSIGGGVARLRLVGPCTSGGSTYTVANLLVTNLKQFPTITTVKVLDAAGNTGSPSGPIDSIPGCLEP